MGLFNKMKSAVTGQDNDLLANGVLGRGVIMGGDITGTSITMGGVEYRVVKFTVEVTLDDKAPYVAECRQRIPVWNIGQIQPGATVVAVRVDPQDPTRVAIDFTTPAPTVRLAQGASQGSAADVLARGVSARGVILESAPLGMTNPQGVPMHGFVLTVLPNGSAPYQARVGNPVPAGAELLIYPGAQVPVRYLPEDPSGVVIDWDGARAAMGA